MRHADDSPPRKRPASVFIPLEEAPLEEAPLEEAPLEEAPLEEAPLEEAPLDEVPFRKRPFQGAPLSAQGLEPTEGASRVQEMQERWRWTLEATGAGFWEWDPFTGRLVWDLQLHHLLGLSLESVTLDASGFVQDPSQESRTRVYQAVTCLLDDELAYENNGGGAYDARFQLAGKSRLYPLHAGAPERICGTVWSNPPGLRLAKEQQPFIDELHALRLRFETVLRQLPAGVLIANASTERLLLCNAQTYTILGDLFTDHMSIGRPGKVSESPHAPGCRYFPQDWPLVQALRTGEEVRHQEISLECRDGRTLTVIANAAPIRGPHGRVVAAVLAFQDISARKQAEEGLRQANEQLETRVTDRTHELQQTNEALTKQLVIREQLMHLLRLERGRLEAILRQMPAGVLIAEPPAGRVVLSNAQLEQLLSLRPAPSMEEGPCRDVALHANGTPYEPDEWPLSRALARGEIITAEEMTVLREDGTRSVLRVSAAPIRDREERITAGVATFYDITEQRAAERDREALLQQLVSVQEQERRRLSLELHDHLGQQISALLVGLSSLREGIPPHLHGQLEQLQSLTRQVDLDIDRICQGLRPPMLDDFGLSMALQHHVEEWSRLSRIPVDLFIRGLDHGRLPPPIEITLYRIAQEALTNVLKHAAASQVSVIVERKIEHVLAIIEDNGRGFDSNAPSSQQEQGRMLGLVGMRERVTPLGGTVVVETSPGTGTAVFVRIPLEGAGTRNGPEKPGSG